MKIYGQLDAKLASQLVIDLKPLKVGAFGPEGSFDLNQKFAVCSNSLKIDSMKTMNRFMISRNNSLSIRQF